MPTFVTIAYGEPAGMTRTPAEVREIVFARDKLLLDRGATIGIAHDSVQVRNPQNVGVEVIAGAFMSSRLPVAGFGIFDAVDLDEAVALVSRTPCAVMHGVVEVWPLERLSGQR